MTKKTKIFLLVSIGFIALTILPVTAQNQGGGGEYPAEFYYVKVPVEKVFIYKKGYVVLYRQSGLSLGQAYIPYEWFAVDSRKGVIQYLPNGKTMPSMSVFYSKGAFHSVRLYVPQDMHNEAWGFIPFSTNLDDKFEGVESIELGPAKK